MALPPALLQHVEQHACFTGCYGSSSDASACLAPTQPLQPLVVVSCRDCLDKIAVPHALLPTGTDSYSLSRQLTDHMQQKRGSRLAQSGYHSNGPGFWLSFVYYDCGLFLISAERSRQLGGDLDVLLLGFQHKVAVPPDPRMTDPRHYRTETVHVHFANAQPVTSKAQLMASPQVRTQAHPGWHKVTLAEFLPVANPAQPAAPAKASAARAAAAPRALQVGDRCPKCGARVKARPLLNGSFVGCLC